MLLRVVNGIARDDALRFVIILPSRVQVPIEAREVAACHFEANPVARLEKIAGRHRLQRYLVDLSDLHPDQGLVVAVPIPHTLDGLVQVIGPPVQIDVDQFDREVCVLIRLPEGGRSLCDVGGSCGRDAARVRRVLRNDMSDGPESEANLRRAIKKAPSEEGALSAFHVRDLTG